MTTPSFAKRHQRVDALVNCAGILARDKEFEIETFMKVLDVNLAGTFRTCMAFRPMLAESKGSIVNIASMNATLALPRIPAYCASKGGVVMLTKALALKWAEEGIRVNAVAPGYIETAINAAATDHAHFQRGPHRVQTLGTAGGHRGAVAFPACRPRNTRPAPWLQSTADFCRLVDSAFSTVDHLDQCPAARSAATVARASRVSPRIPVLLLGKVSDEDRGADDARRVIPASFR